MAKRTGLTTLLDLARKICQIIVTFGPVLRSAIPTNQRVYLDALNQACSDFVLNVDPPATLIDDPNDTLST